MAVPEDARVDEKDKRKIDNYHDLAMKLSRLWKVKTKVILIVVGALYEQYPNTLEKKLKRAGTTVSVELLQKTACLGTAHTEGHLCPTHHSRYSVEYRHCSDEIRKWVIMVVLENPLFGLDSKKSF